MRAIGRRLGVGAGAVVALALVVEIGLAVAGLRFRFPPACTWDAGLGCMTRANAEIEFAFARTRFSFRTNPLGLRDRARGDKPPGTRRVLVLGDSLPFGVLVEAGQTFPALLEARLGERGVEVVNGSSIHLKATEQQLSFYLDRGRALRPDLVVLAFNAQNDFADNSHRLFWRRGADGSLVRVADPAPASTLHRIVLGTLDTAPVRLLDAHSSLFGLCRGLGFSLMHLPRATAPLEEIRAASEDTVARLAAEVARDGARFAVVVLPHPEVALRSPHREGDPDASEERAAAAMVAKHGIPLLDLTDRLSPAAGGPPLFQEDNHLTVAGHAAVADALAGPLLDWLERPPRP